jgi:hypothetical protein
MSVEVSGRVIRAIDLGADSFRLGFKALPGNVQDEARTVLRSLLLTHLDEIPAKLHFHQMAGKTAPSRLDPKKKVAVWSLHIVASDDYKASFTFENGTLYFRVADTHKKVDKNP